MKHPTFKLIIVTKYLKKEISRKQVVFFYNISKSTLHRWVNLYKNKKLLKKRKYILAKRVVSNTEGVDKRIKYKIPIIIKYFIGAYVSREINFAYKKLINIIKIIFKINICKSSIYNMLVKLNFYT